jgi:hypothetical protein
MKTIINYTTSNNSYNQTIDHLDYKCSAQDYIDGCRMNNGGEYWANDIGATITARVYEDDADPMFDDPATITSAEILPEN